LDHSDTVTAVQIPLEALTYVCMFLYWVM